MSQPRRTFSAGSESLSTNASSTHGGRRPVRHTVEVRSTNSAGPIRPNRLVPGLSAASREAIQRSGSSAGSVSSSQGGGGGGGVITPFHASNLNTGLSTPTPSAGGAGSRQRLRLGGGNTSGAGSSSGSRQAFRAIDDEEVEDENAALLAQVMKKREEAEKDRERRSVMSNYDTHRGNHPSVPRSDRSSASTVHHPPGTARSAATTSASSLGLRSAISTVSSLSMKALSKIEQALGRELPLSRDGSKVVLSKDDVQRIKDQETLSFLSEYGSLFVNSMREDKKLSEQLQESSDEKAEDEKTVPDSDTTIEEKKSQEQRKAPKFSSADVEATMNQLAQEIATFITATDDEGKDYNIPTEAASGELHVPLLSADGEDHEANVLLLGGVEDDDEDKDLTGFEDLLAANTPARSREEEDVPEEAEKSKEEEGREHSSQDPDSEEVFQRKLQEVLSEEAEEKLLLGDIPELAEGEDGKEDALLYGEKNPKERGEEEEEEEIPEEVVGGPPPQQPPANKSAFTSTFCSRPTKKQDTPQTRDGTGGSDTSSISRLGKKKQGAAGPVQGPTKALQKDAFYKLNSDEEARVQWILDNEDWDKKAGGGAREHKGLNDENDGDETHSTAPSTTTSGVTSSSSSSSSSKLHYDPTSATSYAPSDGYGQDKETQQRLEDIEARLERLQKARSLAGGPNLEGLGFTAAIAGGERLQLGSGDKVKLLMNAPTAPDDEMIEEEITSISQEETDIANRKKEDRYRKTPTSSPKKASSSNGTTPVKASPSGVEKKSNVNIPTPPKKSSSSSASTAGTDTIIDEGEQKRLDAKKKGNEVLHNQRVHRSERKMMNQLNDRLSDISSQLELLSQPPFSLEVQYDLDQDPKDLQYPPGLAPPEEDQIQALLAQCKEEQRLYSDLA